jgi:hypothetical protein
MLCKDAPDKRVFDWAEVKLANLAASGLQYGTLETLNRKIFRDLSGRQPVVFTETPQILSHIGQQRSPPSLWPSCRLALTRFHTG